MTRTQTLWAILLLLVACPPARAATTVFTNEASFLAAAGTPTTVDFDLLSDGDAIAGQFAGEGVTFEGFSGGSANARALTIPPFCMDNHSEPMSFQTVSDLQGGGGFKTSFAPPVDAVGLWIGDLEAVSGNTTLTLLDASNQSLGSFDLLTELGDSPCTWKFFGVTSDVPIYAVTVSISVFDYVLFDDLYFVTSPTAEPAIGFLSGGQGCDSQDCTNPTHVFDSATGVGNGLLELSGSTLDFRVGIGSAIFTPIICPTPIFEFSDVVYSGTASVNTAGSTHTITSGTALISGTGGDVVCPNPFTTSALDVSGSCEGAGSALSCELSFTLTDPAFLVEGQQYFFVHTVMTSGAEAAVPALGPAALVALALMLFLVAIMYGRKAASI